MDQLTHADKLNSFTSKLRQRYNELNNIRSEYDMIEQDILHFIEFEKYDAVAGAKLLKKLKETRISRRETKNEYEELQSILRRMKNAGLNNYKRPKKKYTYRTVTLERILNGK